MAAVCRASRNSEIPASHQICFFVRRVPAVKTEMRRFDNRAGRNRPAQSPINVLILSVLSRSVRNHPPGTLRNLNIISAYRRRETLSKLVACSQETEKFVGDRTDASDRVWFQFERLFWRSDVSLHVFRFRFPPENNAIWCFSVCPTQGKNRKLPSSRNPGCERRITKAINEKPHQISLSSSEYSPSETRPVICRPESPPRRQQKHGPTVMQSPNSSTNEPRLWKRPLLHYGAGFGRLRALVARFGGTWTTS